MSQRPGKHSLTLHGHRTSVSLEPEFWEEFCRIAAQKGISVNLLAAKVDNERQEMGLATAMRLTVLRHLQDLNHRQNPGPEGATQDI